MTDEQEMLKLRIENLEACLMILCNRIEISDGTDRLLNRIRDMISNPKLYQSE